MADTENDTHDEPVKSDRDGYDSDDIETIQKRFKTCLEAMNDIFEEAREIDLFSYDLQQWPDNIKRDRDQDDRPCLVMDETYWV